MSFSHEKKSILIGILASLFFAFTFILNRLMATEGNDWIWSSSLRFYWMLPLFVIIVLIRKNLVAVFIEIKKNFVGWILWSSVGFGLFYAPLTYSASFSPSWLVASTWQFTIIAGLILAPFIYKTRSSFSIFCFLFSGLILAGIVVMQISQMKVIDPIEMVIGSGWIILAAFCYPLGNRKMMLITKGKLDVYQRILGMIICSLPFWFLLNLYAIFVDHSLPTQNQLVQTFMVGIFSGGIATTLFFYATDLVNNDHKALASVEATQSGEVIFTLIGEMLILRILLPDIYALFGMGFVILGMILHSLYSKIND